jgi:hypothetical protein
MGAQLFHDSIGLGGDFPVNKQGSNFSVLFSAAPPSVHVRLIREIRNTSSLRLIARSLTP